MGDIKKKIYNLIKKSDTIVIARHVGADPDALGSSIGLKESILATFPNKSVYVVGNPATKFKYLGNLDKIPSDISKNSLLIVTDTPNIKRIDGANPDDFKYVIKIDHHPFIEKFADIEWIDTTSSSASQMIMELIFSTKLVMTKKTAEDLYIGLVSDTDRFLFSYTTAKTFSLVSRLLEETGIEIVPLYKDLFMRPFKEMRFEGYISNHLEVTEHGFAYAFLDEDALNRYKVDAATAGNMVNNFNYISDFVAWAVFSVDKANNNIRGSIRSRGPVINEVAAKYNGGGHEFASGVRLNSIEEVEAMARDYDKVCEEYNKNFEKK